MSPGTPPRTTKSAGEPSLRDSLVVLAHELRNPLMLIRTEVALLRRDNVHRASVVESCAVVDHQLNQLAALIEDVVGLARLEDGERHDAQRRLDARDLIHATVSAIAAVVETREIGLVVDVGDDPLTVLGNPVRLTQALTNLLTNAAKFTDPGGTIIVIASGDKHWVEVSIRDTGRGIPMEALDAVFTPFVRGASSTAVEGSGIGLAVAHHVIAAHGGSLQGKSEGLGLGSEFVIRLPAAG